MAVWKLVCLLCLVTVACVAPDPCVTAKLRDANLRSSDNVYNPAQTTPLFCDLTLPEGWYKFEDNGLPTDMATNLPELGSCNTIYPVYLNGQLPQTVGEQVDREACVRAGSNCAVKKPVKVKKCNGFNVYFLKPVESCPTAYCFNTATASGPCSPGHSSETGMQPGCSDIFPDIEVTPVVKPGLTIILFALDQLYFECTANNLNAAYFYDVVWFVNDIEVHRYKGLAADTLPQSARLLEDHWRLNFKMGMNVKCAIRARFAKTETPSPEHQSQVFFAGIKIIGDTAIQLVEGEPGRTVQLQSTVPIPCLIAGPFCSLQINVVRNRNTECSAKIDSCSIQIKGDDWNAIHEITITGTHDGQYGDKVAEFVFRATTNVPNGGTVWDVLETAPVLVNIIDTDTKVAGSICTIVNDPHLTTFDKKAFDVHLHGEFILYRHKTLPYEVRGFFQECYTGSRSHCVCGAAVRSANQYFVWTKCKDNLYNITNGAFQTSRLDVYGCSSRQLSVTQDNNDIYKVKVPSGMEVTIGTYGYIQIAPSAADVAQTEGLCGNFNGDATDEFIDPDGIQHSNNCETKLFEHIDGFCMVPTYSMTWGITDPSKTLYNGMMQEHLEPPLTAHCYCDNNDVVKCENKPPQCKNTNLVGDDVTDQYCTQLNKRRRKRSISSPGEPIAIFPHEPFVPGPPLKTDVWPIGWTAQKAEQHCRGSFDSLQFAQACKQVPNLNHERMIESCMADIALSGTTEWTAVTAEAHKVQCLTEAAKNASLWKDEGQGQTVLQNILENSCPGECSGNGACTKGRCDCTAPWIGSDCGVDGSLPPNVILLMPYGGLCDLFEDDCREIVVRGGVFVKSVSLSCRFTVVNIPGGTESGTLFDVTSPAIYRHSSEVVCRLPADVDASSGLGIYVTVSNQNNQFGAGKLFLPYDSSCFECSINGDTSGSCQLQTTFCYLENTCVRDGQSSPSGQPCNKGPHSCQSGWQSFQGSCYYFHLQKQPHLDQEGAQNECRLRNVDSSLVAIETRDEFNFLRNYLVQQYENIKSFISNDWMTSGHQGNINQWIWNSTGSTVDFENVISWANTRPLHNHALSCLSFYPANGLENITDVRCEKFPRQYICEV